MNAPAAPSASEPATKKNARWGLAAIAGIVLAVLIAWMAYSPYYTLRQIRSADAIDLPKYVDFAAVRESAKDQLIATMQASFPPGPDGKPDPMAKMAMAMAGAMMPMVIESIITPDTVAKMAAGKKVDLKLSASSGGSIREKVEASSPAAGTSPDEPGDRTPDPDVHMTSGYTAWDRFVLVLTKAEEPDAPLKLVMTRAGLGWKVVAIEFPTAKH